MLLAFQKMTNIRACLASNDKIQPGWIGMRTRCCDNLYRLAISQRNAQRHQAAINLSCNTAITHPRMDSIGKINRRRPLGQLHNMSFRRKDIDLIWEEINFDILYEFQRTPCTAL